jgi:uncharacterized protein
MQPIFLTAEWRKLALANYDVDPSVLKKFLPARTELDFWNGRCYVSLVGFMFQNVKVLGVPVPFHREFEEVNLRLYVKFKEGNEWKRGVVFIREIVPKTAITMVANILYGENYRTLPMRHSWETGSDGHLEVSYEWKTGVLWNRFSVSALPHPVHFEAGSEEEFITQHFWGYTKLKGERTSEYQVEHPAWQVYEVKDHKIEVDGERLYGKPFGEILNRIPESVFLAEGSEILVRKGKSV